MCRNMSADMTYLCPKRANKAADVGQGRLLQSIDFFMQTVYILTYISSASADAKLCETFFGKPIYYSLVTGIKVT